MREELPPRVEWEVQEPGVDPENPQQPRWRKVIASANYDFALACLREKAWRDQGFSVRLIYREIQEWVYEPEEDPRLVP